jgi:hypothetical protein
MRRTFALARRSAAVVVATASLASCSAAAPDPASFAPSEPAIDEGTDPVTSSLPVGSVLQATANLNLRKGASSSYSVLEVIPKGDTVTLLQSAPSNGYYKVDHDGTVGWSYGKYLSLVKNGGGGSGGGSGGGGGTAGGGSGSSPGQPWSCNGTYGTTKVAGGDYYATSFGCWKDSNGVTHTDPGDNCIPGCLSQAKSDGVCAGLSGMSCELKVNWYAADAGRFGCLTRLRVQNPKNGRCAVVMTLDYGPACWVEKNASHGIVDLSGRATDYLFGSGPGWGDKAAVIVTEVASSTPLGPC